MHTERGLRVIVGAAIVADGRVLSCERADPPETAGRWEFPGGKVEPGETEVEALVRECVEELGARVHVGERVGEDVRLGHGRAVLKVYLARLVNGDRPQALEHAALRWLAADELDSVPWLPADAPIVAALRPLLAPAPGGKAPGQGGKAPAQGGKAPAQGGKAPAQGGKTLAMGDEARPPGKASPDGDEVG